MTKADAGEPWDMLALVRLVVDPPEEGLRRGEVGTIVEVFEQPDRAYEVEFVDDAGRTQALVVLRPEQLERVDPPPEHER